MNQYRVENGKVFKFDKDADAYVYDGCFLQYRAKNLKEYRLKKVIKDIIDYNRQNETDWNKI